MGELGGFLKIERRNFAAGMSGGLAFVLDEDGTFASRVNPMMVDQLEPLEESDAIELHALVTEHRDRTGSPVAERVLADFQALKDKFVKVFPADYKRVLAELAAQEDAQTYEVSDEEGHTADVVGVPDTRVADEGE